MNNLLTCKIKPIYIKYLFSAAGSALATSVFGMIDSMVIGKYHGPSGTASIAVFNPLWSIIFSLALLFGIGGSVLFANFRGKGDEKSAEQFFTASLIFGAVASAIAMLVIGLLQDEFFILFGANEELLSMSKLYLRPILYAIPSSIFATILSSYLRNDNNPTLASVAVIVGGLFNAVGDVFFVFALDMGIYGAGLATAIGQFIMLLIMLPHFFRKKNTLRIVRVKNPFKKLGEISLNGFSTAINDLSMGIISILFNRQIMEHLGSDALAVYGVITAVTAFAQCISYGAGQAAQPIISQNHGAGQFGRIKICLRYGLVTCAAMGIFWVALMMIFPTAAVTVFMKPTEGVLEIAPSILRAYGISYLLLPLNIFLTYYFQAIMQPRISTTASVMRGAVVSGILILVMPAIFGPNSVWYSMLVTELIVSAFGIYYLRKCNREMF